MTSVINI